MQADFFDTIRRFGRWLLRTLRHPIRSFIGLVLLHPRRFAVIMYLPLYFIFFELIEWHDFSSMHRIHTPLDSYIPFVEIFVVPYILWFFYLFFAFYYLYKREDPRPFYMLCGSCFLAMTIFLIVSVAYPNYHDLRPITFPRDNVFTHILSVLYSVDPAMNLLPSIHVCATVSAHTALTKSPDFSRLSHSRETSFVISVLIILATLFIKQHSTLDVTLALILMSAEYPFFFGRFSERYLAHIAHRYDSELLEFLEPEGAARVRRHSQVASRR